MNTENKAGSIKIDEVDLGKQGRWHNGLIRGRQRKRDGKSKRHWEFIQNSLKYWMWQLRFISLG
jgi:hypothetical protein